MASPIPALKKGGGPTFLDTEFAQKAIDIINALINAQITPSGIGKISIAKDQLVIDLSALQKTLESTGIASGSGGGGGGGGVQQQIDQLKQQVNQLQQAIDGASIVCNGDGTITWNPG